MNAPLPLVSTGPAAPEVGQVFRGKHRDNQAIFLRVLATTATHALGQSSTTGTRSWSRHDHLHKRYQLWTGEAPAFPEVTGPPPAPPAEEAAPAVEQMPLPAPTRLEVAFEGEPAERLLTLVDHYNRALRGTGARVTPTTLLEDLIEVEAGKVKP